MSRNEEAVNSSSGYNGGGSDIEIKIDIDKVEIDEVEINIGD